MLGAYGLIGSAICHRLLAAGLRVTASGRSAESAQRVLPDLPFRPADLGRMSPGDWSGLLMGITCVVNAAGALQDGPDDDLETLHHLAPADLAAQSARDGIRIVQISAVGAEETAETVFLASKALGDAAMLASGADVVVLRPGMVLGRAAYGGSLLVRMLATVPGVQPMALPEAQIQTVALSDVAEAVLQAATGALPPGSSWDLVEDTPHGLARVVEAHRHALGVAPARWQITLPERVLPLVGRVADALGHLGWRSPLRSTALNTLRGGVLGDPAPWRNRFGALSSLKEALARSGLDSAHRVQARAALLAPLAVATLALFWALSGLVGFWQVKAAAQHLTAVGWSDGMARGTVIFWAVVDLALAGAVLYRPWLGKACLGMVVVSAIYLGSATLLTPGLWADPLGPMVKALPAIMLATITPFLVDRR